MAKRKLDKNQTAVEDAPTSTTFDWMNDELFVFGHGPLMNAWFTRDQVATRSTAQKRMRASGSTTSYGPLDYVPTVKQIPHPQFPQVLGTLCVLMDTSPWSPPSPQPPPPDE